MMKVKATEEPGVNLGTFDLTAATMALEDDLNMDNNAAEASAVILPATCDPRVIINFRCRI